MARHGDLQRSEWEDRQYPIQEDMRAQRMTWHVERCGWLVLLALVVLILLGATTTGPLSTTTVTDASGRFSATYQRIQRHDARTRLSVTVTPQTAGQQTVKLNAAFLRAVAISGVHPEPVLWRGSKDGAELVFDSADGAPFSVQFSLRPHALGLVRGAIGPIDGDAGGDAKPAPLTVFILP